MTILASTKCRMAVLSCQFSAVSRQLSALGFLAFTGFFSTLSFAQSNSGMSDTAAPIPISSSTIALRASSTMNVVSEMGGAFMSSSKCDADGNLYIRKFAMDRPLLGPVVKIDADGKRVALFDPAAFSQLGIERADAFSPASDGGLYQIAQSGGLKPRIYVLHYSSDGSAAAPALLDADFEVYTFAAFAGGNFLVSGVRRDAQNKDDHGRNFTAVFSADGRELAQLSFDDVAGRGKAGRKGQLKSAAPALDLSEAEVGGDGYLYVMRPSSPALVYAIAPSGKIMETLKVAAPLAGAMPNAFHVSENRLAIVFSQDENQGPAVVVADAQTGEKVARYAAAVALGTSFACFSANDGVFTFLKLGEGNALEVVRAEAQ
jgi:hypothetical protein